MLHEMELHVRAIAIILWTKKQELFYKKAKDGFLTALEEGFIQQIDLYFKNHSIETFDDILNLGLHPEN